MTEVSAAARPLVAVALVAVLIGGQALSAAPASGNGTTDAVGRAGFAYLTGLRRFAALLLWDRLEPQYHEYYSELSTKDQTFLVPNIRLVLLLDPQFVQAHYMIVWIVAENGKLPEALALARTSIDENPRSGLLRMSYAQLLYLRTSDLAGSARQAEACLADDMVWADGTEQWQAMMVARDILTKAGEPELAQRAVTIARQVETDLGSAPGFRDPDEQF